MRDDPRSAEVNAGPPSHRAASRWAFAGSNVRRHVFRIPRSPFRLILILQAEPPLGHPSALRHYSAVAPTSFTIFAQKPVWFLRKVANSSGDLLVTISAPPFAMRLTTSGSSMVLIITA